MKVVLDPGALAPTRAHEKDAGLDIYSREEIIVPAQSSCVLHTGVHIELPENTVGMLKSKSGLMVRHAITSEGTIDEGYQGEILVKLFNHSHAGYKVYRGDKITQLVVLPCVRESVEIVESFTAKTARGNNGIGSSGR